MGLELINRDSKAICCCCKKEFIWEAHRAYGGYHEGTTSEGYDYPLITCEDCYRNKTSEECGRKCEGTK